MFQTTRRKKDEKEVCRTARYLGDDYSGTYRCHTRVDLPCKSTDATLCLPDDGDRNCQLLDVWRVESQDSNRMHSPVRPTRPEISRDWATVMTTAHEFLDLPWKEPKSPGQSRT